MHRAAEIHPGASSEHKEGHRSHGVLMDRINRVPFKDSAGRGVILPPPLALRALRSANRLAAIPRPIKSGLKLVCLGELGQRVNGIYLVGKAANASSEHTGK